MKSIWAPWRIQYITKTKKGCFLCEKAAGVGEDRLNLVLKRGKSWFVLMNTYPYNNGHLLIAPYRHVGTPDQLNAEENAEFWPIVNLSLDTLRTSFKAQGFNMGINLGKVAGAGLDGHLHMHIVPRWAGDTNFMPLLAEVKVISEHLRASFEKLWPYFNPEG
jgi:ATP adenylyltransferase